jgi:hypothetical protein
MIDLFDSDADDDDTIPDFDSPAEGKERERESAAEAIALLALEAAIDRRTQAILKQHPRLIIVKVPHTDWVVPIHQVVKRMERAPYVCLALERKRVAGVYQRIGGDNLQYLRQGRSVMYLSPDPAEILDEAILAAADTTIEIAALSADLLRTAIRRVTGGVARGVTDQMAALDLPVIFAVVRGDLSAGACVTKLRQAVERKRQTASAVPVPLLTALPLTEPVRKWSDQTLADLRAVRDGSMAPDQIVYSMLEGPPGTGKTLLAESLARTAGWAFVPATVGGWFTAGDGALGGVARNVRAFIDHVLASAPAIGFLDELDALPNRATMDNRGRDWWLPVITLFLTEIDRLRKSGKAVMLIGATNYYRLLDGALIRPGRLQQRVSVLPAQTEPEVVALMRFYLKDELSDAELVKLARLGRGSTPAMVEGWAKEARAAARAAGHPLRSLDMLEQMLPRDERTAEDIRTIALHEVGHAVVAHRLGLKVDSVSIVPGDGSGGQTKTSMSSIVPTWDGICDIVTTTLGGRAADASLGSGPNAGAESDLANATTMLINAIERQGLGERLAYVPELGPRRPELMTSVEAHLARLLKRATSIIQADRHHVLRLAERLVAERILGGADVAAALDAAPARAQRAKGSRAPTEVARRSRRPMPLKRRSA